MPTVTADRITARTAKRKAAAEYHPEALRALREALLQNEAVQDALRENLSAALRQHPEPRGLKP